jgi:hypothetical protein
MSTQPEVAITIITGGQGGGSQVTASAGGTPVPAALEQLGAEASGDAGGTGLGGPVPVPLDELAAAAAGGSTGSAGGTAAPTPTDQLAAAAAEVMLPEPTDLSGVAAGGPAADEVPVPSGAPDAAAAVGAAMPVDLDELERAAAASTGSKKAAAKKSAAKKSAARKKTAAKKRAG